MINALKSDELVKRVGGPFRLTALVHRRLRELVEGARPLVEPRDKTLVEIAVEEIDQGKIVIDYEKSEGIHQISEDGLVENDDISNTKIEEDL